MTEIALREVVAVSGGGTPRKSVAAYYGGRIPWVTPKDMKRPLIGESQVTLTDEGLRNSPAKLVPERSVLVVVRSGVLKHTLPVALTTRPVTVNQDMKALTPSPGLDSAYLARMLKSLQPTVLSWVRATTADNFPIDNLLDLKIELPPLPEQRRIAAILDHADAIRAKRRQVLACLDTLTQSIFHDMFGGRDDHLVRLDSLVDSDDRMNYGVVQPGDHFHDGVPLIRVSNLVDGGVDRRDLKRISPEIDGTYRRSRIRGTEVLVSSVGSIGKISLVGQVDVGSNLARAITRVPIADPVLRSFVASYLRTEVAQRYFTAELRTVAQPTLNVKQLAATEVRLPPEELQRTFVDRVEQINAQRTPVLAAQAATDELFAALQSRAFRGDL